MIIRERALRQYVRSLLLQEALVDRLVQKNPQYGEKLLHAANKGVSNAGLQWLLRHFKNEDDEGYDEEDKEPVDDIIPVLIDFDKNKAAIGARARGDNPGGIFNADINHYKNVGALRYMFHELHKKQRGKREKEDIKRTQTTYIYKGPKYNVVMPHTVESSCFWGLDTTWCTAATKSQNLFLSYVGRKDQNIVLYYIVEKGVDPRKHPFAKMSVGFVNGEPVLKGDSGGVSVNVRNDGLTKHMLQSKLGSEYQPIMAAMKKHSGAIGGKHPAKHQMEAAAKDPAELQKRIRNLGDEELKDFLRMVINKYDPSTEVRNEISKIPVEKAGRDNLSNLVVKWGWSDEPSEFYDIPVEALERLAASDEYHVARAAVLHPKATNKMLLDLVTPGVLPLSANPSMIKSIISKKNLPTNVLDVMIKSGKSSTLSEMSKNPTLPKEYYHMIYDKLASIRKSGTLRDEGVYPTDVEIALARNKSTPSDILHQLVNTAHYSTVLPVASNPNIAPETIDALLARGKEHWGDRKGIVRALVRNEEGVPLSAVEKLLKGRYGGDIRMRQGATHRRDATPEILMLALGDNPTDRDFGSVWKDVASFTKFPAVLRKIYEWAEPNENEWLISAVLENEHTPRDIQERYVDIALQDPRGNTSAGKNLGYLLKNRKLPGELLEKLVAAIPDSSLAQLYGRYVVDNDGASPETLRRIAAHDNNRANSNREGIFMSGHPHPNITVEVIEAAVKNKNGSWRPVNMYSATWWEGIIDHELTPDYILEYLAYELAPRQGGATRHVHEAAKRALQKRGKGKINESRRTLDRWKLLAGIR